MACLSMIELRETTKPDSADSLCEGGSRHAEYCTKLQFNDSHLFHGQVCSLGNFTLKSARQALAS